MPLRFLTAGESHGPALVGLLDGLPAGLAFTEEDLVGDLARRQRVAGRGGRQRIEKDRARILGGLVRGRTTGAPVALLIENLDYANWESLAVAPNRVPRPGHADLAGCLKWGQTDTRTVSERASARETAMRTALGGVAKRLLAEVGIRCVAQVEALGPVRAKLRPLAPDRLAAAVDRSPLRCADPRAAAAMARALARARAAGETLGGAVRVEAHGVPAGLGSSVQWDRRLDGRLAQALMSIPSVKGVMIGEAERQALLPGSRAQDPILWRAGRGFVRPGNLAGGIEGGMTNGAPVVARLLLKPISTLKRGLASVDLATRRARPAAYQRSDTCVVPAATVVAEAMTAWILADALLERHGGDTLAALRRGVAADRRRAGSK